MIPPLSPPHRPPDNSESSKPLGWIRECRRPALATRQRGFARGSVTGGPVEPAPTKFREGSGSFTGYPVKLPAARYDQSVTCTAGGNRPWTTARPRSIDWIARGVVTKRVISSADGVAFRPGRVEMLQAP